MPAEVALIPASLFLLPPPAPLLSQIQSKIKTAIAYLGLRQLNHLAHCKWQVLFLTISATIAIKIIGQWWLLWDVAYKRSFEIFDTYW